MKKSKIRNFFKRSYPYLCILGLTFIILYPQMRSGTYLAGLDSWFHMNQFYDAAMQFKTGHFSYFISLYGFGGIGRIVNAIYGPGFVYLGGLILLMVRTWFRFEIFQDLLGLILGGTFFYLLARKNRVARSIATLFSLLYMMSGPIMTLLINQEFNGIEAVMMPLILLQGTQMARKERIHPLSLGIVMAIVFQTHMLTTLMGTVALIPFFIYAWVRSVHKFQLWKDLIISVAITTALTANVWGSILNIFPQGLIPPIPQGLPTYGGSIVWRVPGHYFSVLGFAYTIIMAFSIFCCLLGLIFWRRSNAMYKIISIMGLFFCWISTDYVPWRWIFKIYPEFIYQIQYPKRFLSVGIALVFLAVGMLLDSQQVKLFDTRERLLQHLTLIFVQIILLVFVGGSCVYQQRLIRNAAAYYYTDSVIAYHPFYSYLHSPARAQRLRKAYHTPGSLGKSLNFIHQDTPDYLPTKNNVQTYRRYRGNAPYSGLQRQVYDDIRYLRIRKTTTNNRLTMTWKQRHNKRNVILPVTKYRDTRVVFNHKVLKSPQISRIGMTKVSQVPKGHNTISISYQAPIWLHALMWITVISWLGVIMRLIWHI